MSSSDSAWLVKSNGRILGPFTEEEVREKLRSKEIVVLDEVAQSFRRWRYVRDHELFLDTVEEVRKQNFGANEDHTLTVTTGQQTQSITERLFNTQNTEEIALDASESPLQEASDDIIIEDLDEVSSQPGTRISHGNQPKAYVPANQARRITDSSSDSTSRVLWLMVVLVVVGVVGFVFYSRSQMEKTKVAVPSEKNKEKGLEHYFAGDYDLALPFLLKAYQSNPSDLELSSLIAPVLIQQGPTGYVTADQMIKRLKNGGKRYLARSSLLEGLLLLKRNEYPVAIEALLKVVANDSFSWQGFANLGVASFLSKDYVSARNHFEAALKIELQRSTSRGEAYLMRTQTEIELWKATGDERYLVQAEKGIDSYLSEYADYRQEALLLRAFVEFARNDLGRASSTIKELIDTDPFLTNEHAKDPSVYRDTLEWSYLLKRCQAIVSGMTSSAQLETLHALCLIQTKDKDIEAQEVINAAVNQNPTDPLIQGVFAFVNWHLGSDMKAEMLATKAIEMNSNDEVKLPHIIKARICESLENFECALQEWQQVRLKDEESVSALAGVSVSYLNMKKFSLFESSFHSARKYSRYYKPLLRAQVKASKEGIRIRK